MQVLNEDIIKNLNGLTKFKIPINLKIKLSLIISGLKPNLTIEYFNKAYLYEIEQISKYFNLNYKFIEYPNFSKLIIGLKKGDVEELFFLEKKIFRESETSQNYHYRYGILMGYPPCCCSSKRLKINYSKLKIEKNCESKNAGFAIKIKNRVGVYYSSQNPWPWETCFFSGLIFHTPCSPNCKLTNILGQKHLLIKTLIMAQELNLINDNYSFCKNDKAASILKKLLISKNKGYVLHFARNLYCMFFAIKKGGSFHIKKIINNFINPHIEGTDKNIDFTEQGRILSKVSVNSKLKIDKDKIEVIKKEKTYTYKKIDFSDGCIIQFK